MLNLPGSDAQERGRILAHYASPVASDLTLLDLGPLVGYIVSDRIDNLASVVDASCELYFAENTLAFCRVCEIDISWEKRPRLLLDMKLHLSGVSALFRLVLSSAAPTIELTFISFDDDTLPEREKTELLRMRLAEACRPDIRRPPDLVANRIRSGVAADQDRNA